MFYSKSTGGFYCREIHGNNMPEDVVEITIEQHTALVEGQSQGKIIGSDDDGYPILICQPSPSPEQLQAQINAEARAYLLSTDWYVTRWQEKQTPIPVEISAERDAARARVVE